MSTDNQTDIVIVTALPKERDAVLNYLTSPEKVEVKGHIYYKSNVRAENGTSDNSVVLLSLSRMGNVQAGITTTQAITVWNPSYVILTGIAGGVQGGERFLGDVVVGEQIVGYEPGKLENGKTQRRFQAFRPASKLLDAALAMKPDQWVFEAKQQRPDGTAGRVIPKVHFGVVASGEKVVKDLDLVTELRTSWAQLIAIEMESFGTAAAAYEAETVPGMLMVKGICDWADPDKNDAWQVYAADIAAAYVVSLLKQIVIQPKKTQARRVDAVTYSGRVKVKVCQNLGPNWKDLAAILGIPYRDLDRFSKGDEGYDIWRWLEQRSKLDALKQALSDIERPDLVDILSAEAPPAEQDQGTYPK